MDTLVKRIGERAIWRLSCHRYDGAHPEIQDKRADRGHEHEAHQCNSNPGGLQAPGS